MTKAVLNKNTITVSPVSMSSRPTIFRIAALTLITVVVFSLLFKLGLWQLDRGYQKERLEHSLIERAKQPPVDLKEIVEAENPTGLSVIAQGRAIPEGYLLLDNQVYKGKVGYLAYQLIEADERYWLLERGFVTAPASRSVLPKVNWKHGDFVYRARVYQRSENPLSNDIDPEFIAPYRIQNLNIAQISQLFGIEIQPVVIQPQAESWPYPQPWVPIPMSSTKHFGYATQWFMMSAVFLGLMTWVSVRALQKRRARGGL
ncbi:SURF1 family protein [Vibrio astriarenae]